MYTVLVRLAGVLDCTTILVFASVFLVLFLAYRKPRGIPPGPTPVPLLGNFHLLASSRGDILGLFRKLRQQYGDIFSFYMGRDLAIVVNGYDVIRQALVNKGTIFSGRPQNYLKLIHAKARGISFSYGQYWKEQRMFTHNCLQKFGLGKTSFENKIQEDVTCFIDALQKENGRPFDFRELIHNSIANVTFSIICGKRHSYDDKKFQEFLNNAEISSELFPRASVLMSVAPFLRFLPGDLLKLRDLQAMYDLFYNYIRTLHVEHIDTYDEDNMRDFMDMYMKEIRKHGDDPNTDFTTEQLISIVIDLFGGGSETTPTTIRWAIIYLLNNPTVQDKLHIEIDSILNGRPPHLEDRPRMPYTEAFTMEVLRIANVGPLAIPHAVLGDDDVTFLGYRFPKDCIILINLDSVLNDETIFQDPKSFNPDRFLDSEGNVIRPKEFIPFGVGRRLCLGESVAKMELFMFLTTMLQKFDFKSPEGEDPPPLNGTLGVAYTPVLYKVCAIPRNM